MNDPREALTRCAWILVDEGHESGPAGRLTARGPRAGTFRTLPPGLAFDDAEEASWPLIDDDLGVLEGEGAFGVREPNPATRFHPGIYRARPEVDAILHTHPPACSALAVARVGGVRPVEADQARRARDFLRADRIMNMTFDAWSRKAMRKRGLASQ